MTKKEEIYKWAYVFLRPICTSDEHAVAYVSDFLRGLSNKGVVIKVERELPIITQKGWYYLMEPLINEE